MSGEKVIQPNDLSLDGFAHDASADQDETGKNYDPHCGCTHTHSHHYIMFSLVGVIITALIVLTVITSIRSINAHKPLSDPGEHSYLMGNKKFCDLTGDDMSSYGLPPMKKVTKGEPPQSEQPFEIKEGKEAGKKYQMKTCHFTCIDSTASCDINITTFAIIPSGRAVPIRDIAREWSLTDNEPYSPVNEGHFRTENGYQIHVFCGMSDVVVVFPGLDVKYYENNVNKKIQSCHQADHLIALFMHSILT